MVLCCRKEKVFRCTQGIKFSPDKISPPQVLGEIGENVPPAKITLYTVLPEVIMIYVIQLNTILVHYA